MLLAILGKNYVSGGIISYISCINYANEAHYEICSIGRNFDKFRLKHRLHKSCTL